MTRARRLAASGWAPALLVYLLSAFLLGHSANLAVRDILAFTVWFGWAHTLPGIVAWRAIDWRGRGGRHERGSGRATGRPFLEDAVLGSIFGVILSIPVYLLAVGAGLPGAILLWPLLVLVPAAALPRGRELLLRRQADRAPAWWSWGLALILVLVVIQLWHVSWSPEPLNAYTLQHPYVDEPYHLALVGEFRHHFPAQVPFVAGTPLEYHWLVYPFVAAGSWGSGVESIVLLRYLVVAVLSALLVLGVAVAAARISGHRWASLAAASVLCMTTPLDVVGWTGAATPWLSAGWLTLRSPTQMFANALCPLLVVLLVGLLRGAARRPHHWVAVFLVMLAVAGAKSAMLPLFVAGLCGTTLVMLVVRRAIPWVTAALAVLSVLVFGLATVLFYGPGSRAMTLKPFQVIDGQALVLHMIDEGQTPSAGVRTVLTVVFVLCAAVPLVGGLGWFVRGGWRRPSPWVLLGCWVAGIGVFLVFSHPGLGQGYFYRSAVVPMAVLAGVGWARAAGSPTRRTAVTIAVAVAGGLCLTVAVSELVPATTPNGARGGSDVGALLEGFGVPLLVALGAVALLLVLYRTATRRAAASPPQALLVAISLLTGMCMVGPIAGLDHKTPPPVNQQMIPDGGIPAARWLRAHSTPDQLVATNVHTPTALGNPENHRTFWIAGYAERRVLVEGWAYIPPESVGLPSNEETNSRFGGGEFWDPGKLRLNDEVFAHPTRENIAELHERYGVDWLFVDRTRKPDLSRLRKLADRQYLGRRFLVFRIGD